jgi:tetratricopeptide (TPR) repeat protein
MRFRPVIRVFVSSTFSDLKAERNILQSKVFPSLEHYCLLRGFQFQAIDLRWGVPGEAGLDHRTMQICFDELRRAQEVSPRPNFLVLLGDRYGWQPLAEEVTETEFRELEKAAGQLDDEASRDKQADESATQVLRTWYRWDENADPVTYTLRSRNEWPEGQQFALEREDEAWKKVEAVLWAVTNRAFPPDGLAGRFAHIPGADEPLPSIVNFQASATEQEIWRGALAVPDAPEHVVAWYRTIRNRHDFLGDARAKDFLDPKEALQVAARELRDELSRKLHKDGEEDIKPVEVDLRVADDPTKLEITRGHLKAMSEEIETRLVRIAEREIAAYWQPTGHTTAAPTPKATGGPSEARKLELERQAHALFGESRAPKDGFVGRDTELEAIAKYLSDQDDRKPLVVHGPSGTGKTALLARAAQIATNRYPDRVIQRYLGTTPGSSNLQSLLTSLCRALSPDPERDLPVEVRLLQEEFDRLLNLATAQKPILLFLDAIDQLDEAEGARQTYWLRTPLAEHVRAVVSCLRNEDTPENPDPLNVPFRAFERRELLDGAIGLDSLTEEEAMQAIDLWLAHPRTGEQKRKTTSAQRDAVRERIHSDTACRRPLYLRILAEEARRWPSWKEVEAGDLGANTAELLGAMFTRLEDKAIHGVELVMASMGYIAASRGLSENEILEVLWADEDYRGHLEEQSRKTQHELPEGATRIPIAIWSRLRHDLARYLAERNAPGAVVLGIYHLEVERVVREHYLPKGPQSVLRHQRLALYFQSGRVGQQWIGAPRRALTEYPYHLWQSGATEPLFTLATDDAFLEAQERVPTEPNLFLHTIDMALSTACRTREPSQMASLTLRRGRKTEARREGNPILVLNDQNMSFADRVSRAWSIIDSLPSQVGVYSTLVLAYRLHSLGSKAEARATIERLGERPVPELGEYCWIAIVILTELEGEFQTSRWAEALLAHPAYLATLSERFAALGNVSAAFTIADQIEHREMKDSSLTEIVKAQTRNSEFEAALDTARRISDLDSLYSVLIEILHAGREAGLDLRTAIHATLRSIKVQGKGAIILYAELGQFKEALKLAAHIQEPSERVDAFCSIALVDLKEIDSWSLLQLAEHALSECDEGSQESARLLIQETRWRVAFQKGDLNLALSLAHAIDNCPDRVRRLSETYTALDDEAKSTFSGEIEGALQVALSIEDDLQRVTALKNVALAMRRSGIDLASVYEAAIRIYANVTRRTETASPYSVESIAELLAITGHFNEAENVASRIAETDVSASAFCKIAEIKVNLGLDPKDVFAKAVAAAQFSRGTALPDIAVVQMRLGFDPLETFMAAIPTSAANLKANNPKILTVTGEIIVLKMRRKMSIATDLRSALDLAANTSSQPEGENAIAVVTDVLARGGCFEGAIEMAANLSTQTLLEETLTKLADDMLESVCPQDPTGLYLLCAKVEDPKSRVHFLARVGELFHKAGLDKSRIFQEGAHIAEGIEDAKQRCQAYCELAMSMANVGLDDLPSMNAAINSANEVKEYECSVGEYEYSSDRTSAVSAIIKALAKTGRTDAAITIALQNLSQDEQSEAIASVATELADAKRFEEALAAAQRIRDGDTRLQAIAEVRARSGRYDEALGAIRRIGEPEIQCPALLRLCRSQLDAGHDITETLRFAVDSARRVQPNDPNPYSSNPFREILELCPARDLDETEIIDEAITWADIADRNETRKGGRASVAMALARRGRYEHALKIAMTTQIEARRLGYVVGLIASAQLSAGKIPEAFAAYDTILAGHSRALELIHTTLLDSASSGLENGAVTEYLLRACRFVDSSICACSVICKAFPESFEDVLNLLNLVKGARVIMFCSPPPKSVKHFEDVN